MKFFLDIHRQLLELMHRHAVDFLVVGGYCVIYHGYMRTTGDLDIWLRPENENRDKLIEVLNKLGVEDEDLDRLALMDFSIPRIFQMWEEPEKVDFLTHISGVDYPEAQKLKIIAEIDGLPIPLLHIDHLVLSKMTSGRLKDQADVEELQKISRYKQE